MKKLYYKIASKYYGALFRYEITLAGMYELLYKEIIHISNNSNMADCIDRKYHYHLRNAENYLILRTKKYLQYNRLIRGW